MNSSPAVFPRYFVYVVVGLIVYASLYPFEFHLPYLLSALQGNWIGAILDAHSGIVDMVANVLFYAPLGFILCARRRAGAALLPRLLGYVTFGAALSTTLEILQFAVPTREPSIIDIALNTLGTLLGALAALSLAQLIPAVRAWSWLRSPQPDRIAYSILASWIVLKGAPFIPRLGLYRISHSLDSLRAGEWTAAGSIESFAVWLITLTALRLAFKRQYFWRATLALGGYAIAAQLLFRQHSWRLDDLLGAIAAFLLIGAMRQQRTNTTMPMVFACTQLAIILAGLAPYRFTDTGKHFIWLPFGGTLDSAVAVAAFALLMKLLLYGGCLWAAMRAGFSRLASTLLVLTTVFIIEAMQLYIPGRVAEITDPLIVLGLALIMSLPQLGVQAESSRRLPVDKYR